MFGLGTIVYMLGGVGEGGRGGTIFMKISSRLSSNAFLYAGPVYTCSSFMISTQGFERFLALSSQLTGVSEALGLSNAKAKRARKRPVKIRAPIPSVI